MIIVELIVKPPRKVGEEGEEDSWDEILSEISIGT